MDRRLFLMSGVAAAGLTLTGERAGIARSVAYEVFVSSAVAAPVVLYRRPVFEHPESAAVTFPIDLVIKDLDLVLALGSEVGAPLPQAEANLAAMRAAAAVGLGSADLPVCNIMDADETVLAEEEAEAATMVAEPKKKDERKKREVPRYNVLLWDSDDHTFEYVEQMLNGGPQGLRGDIDDVLPGHLGGLDLKFNGRDLEALRETAESMIGDDAIGGGADHEGRLQQRLEEMEKRLEQFEQRLRENSGQEVEESSDPSA